MRYFIPATKDYILREGRSQFYSMTDERREKIFALINQNPIDITNDTTTEENAKEVYYNIGSVINSDTGDSVRFVHSAFGKITRHHGYDPRLIGAMKELFKEATFLTEEEPDFITPRGDGSMHKQKINVASFSHYGAKVRIGGRTFYIRYTVQNLVTKKYGAQNHEFHSQQLSEVNITSCNDIDSFLVVPEDLDVDYKLASILFEVRNYYALLQQGLGQ